MKDANKIIKSAKLTKEQKIEKLKERFSKSSDESILKLFEPDFCGRIGFPDYKITNNGANIRRIKLRIEQLVKLNSQQTTEKEINGVRVVDNVEENRLQLFFPCKPSEKVRELLNKSGFRWSGYLGCWQRFRSNGANWAAQDVLKLYKEGV